MCTPQIRNFCIIAHVDHGKSTLADRFIEMTATVAQRDMRELLLDSMEIERERGITIKLQTVCMRYQDENGQPYQFNLVDTPGHVDFSAEVSRSLAACEGAILLIDATQGVQAQTIANLNLAQQAGLTILPVLNKIDSPQANVPLVMQQLADIPSLDITTVLSVSARTGEGVAAVLSVVAHRFPAPKGIANAPLARWCLTHITIPIRAQSCTFAWWMAAFRQDQRCVSCHPARVSTSPKPAFFLPNASLVAS
nr:GTP-binding protein [Pectobacterium sp. PL152]